MPVMGYKRGRERAGHKSKRSTVAVREQTAVAAYLIRKEGRRGWGKLMVVSSVHFFSSSVLPMGKEMDGKFFFLPRNCVQEQSRGDISRRVNAGNEGQTGTRELCHRTATA